MTDYERRTTPEITYRRRPPLQNARALILLSDPRYEHIRKTVGLPDWRTTDLAKMSPQEIRERAMPYVKNVDDEELKDWVQELPVVAENPTVSAIAEAVKDAVSTDGVTDGLASASGAAPPQRTTVGDGHTSGTASTVAHVGGHPLPPAPDQSIEATASTSDEMQASGSEPPRTDSQAGPPSMVGFDTPPSKTIDGGRPRRLPPKRASLVIRRPAPNARIETVPSTSLESFNPAWERFKIRERTLREEQDRKRHSGRRRRPFLEPAFDKGQEQIARAARAFGQQIDERAIREARGREPPRRALLPGARQPRLLPRGPDIPAMPAGVLEFDPMGPGFGPPPAPAAPPAIPVAALPVAGGVIAPIVPIGAVMAIPPGPVLGVAPAVNVSTHREFATSWRGLTIALVDIVLEHGSIRVDGHSATIRVTEKGRRARGDIARISRFIKKRFKLGGYLGGIKMTSQRIIRHIISNLPGTFAITR